MLLSLSIRDFVLVDRLDLSVETGFTALTGETGAGKSILLDALDLTLGGRAESGVVREGSERAEITALFDLADAALLETWLVENGLEGDDGQCLLRRTVDAGGRSRAFINGRPATLGQLKEAGEHLVDIHGQHAHYSLLRPGVQRNLLDVFSAVAPLAAEVAELYKHWQQRARLYRDASQQANHAQTERDRLQWQVDELQGLSFSADAWAATLDEHRRLAHAAELLQGGQAVVAGLDGDEAGVIRQLHDLHARLQGMAELDPALASPLAMLETSLVEVQEAARALSRYAERLDLDPDTLAQLDARIAQVNDAARKYRVSPEALPELLADCQSRLAEMARLADPEGLRQDAEMAESAYLKAAEKLSAGRRKGAAMLAKQVSAALHRLAMQGGRFDVAFESCAPEAGGLESVDFQIAPHAGQGLKSLAKTASGGELSRIGLALQTVMSSLSGAPTLIFDEVDAGIGGGVGEIVGQMLAEIGRERQVLCVTHLPQVAARAGQHWQVSKAAAAGRTLSRVVALDAPGRVDEIARMLGGIKITDTTRQHAQEMLNG